MIFSTHLNTKVLGTTRTTTYQALQQPILKYLLWSTHNLHQTLTSHSTTTCKVEAANYWFKCFTSMFHANKFNKVTNALIDLLTRHCPNINQFFFGLQLTATNYFILPPLFVSLKLVSLLAARPSVLLWFRQTCFLPRKPSSFAASKC